MRMLKGRMLIDNKGFVIVKAKSTLTILSIQYT